MPKQLQKTCPSCCPPSDNGNDVGNTNNKEIEKDGIPGNNGLSGTKYCLNKMEKLAVLA